jgi:CRP-like cAMP-binding protein
MDDGRELRELLRASPTFGRLGAALLADLASAMQREAVAPGQALLREGQAGDALFVVAAGPFELRQRLADGTDEAVGKIGRGDVVGEVPLIVGGLARATVVALGEAEVFRLPRRAFDDLCRAAPMLLDTLVRAVERQLQRRQMLAVLPEMFGPLDAAMLAALERQVNWVTLRSGEVLFRKGDHGDAWYVVTSGRLAIVEPAHNGEADRVISEVGRGEGIGEMALITGQPRSATVYALRDAELARFPVDQVAELLATQPRVTQAMLHGLARRITQQSAASSAGSGVARRGCRRPGATFERRAQALWPDAPNRQRRSQRGRAGPCRGGPSRHAPGLDSRQRLAGRAERGPSLPGAGGRRAAERLEHEGDGTCRSRDHRRRCAR